MIEDVTSATRLAQQKIDEMESSVWNQASMAPCRLVLLPEHTVELDRGWVFFYQSAEYVETGNPSAQLAGNGPVFVSRDGSIHVLPTYMPWEEAIQKIGLKRLPT